MWIRDGKNSDPGFGIHRFFQLCPHLDVQFLAVRNLGEEVANVVAWYGVYYLGQVVVGVGVGGGGRGRRRGQVGANLAREGRVMHAREPTRQV
jgi:hypothetical protein